MKGLIVRAMTREELPWALDLAASEGWNPGLADAGPFFVADPEGFFVAEKDGQPVGSISAVRYGAGFGFIGLYIVAPGQRGHGYGHHLWSRALHHLEGRLTGLDAVLAQQENYGRSGFRTAYKSLRFQGQGGGQRPGPVRSLADADVAAALALDRETFPEERSAFLKAWLTAPGSTALAVDGTKGLAGFGVLRPCGQGHKIGPLQARDTDTAEALFKGLCAAAEKGPVFLDVPAPNTAGMALAESHRLKPVFETARMYDGHAPHVRLDLVYGVTTFELG
jgi:GNAT superfamily N-acetyltransferase